jgi:hypothetical protein
MNYKCPKFIGKTTLIRLQLSPIKSLTEMWDGIFSGKQFLTLNFKEGIIRLRGGTCGSLLPTLVLRGVHRPCQVDECKPSI